MKLRKRWWERFRIPILIRITSTSSLPNRNCFCTFRQTAINTRVSSRKRTNHSPLTLNIKSKTSSSLFIGRSQQRQKKRRNGKHRTHLSSDSDESIDRMWNSVRNKFKCASSECETAFLLLLHRSAGRQLVRNEGDGGAARRDAPIASSSSQTLHALSLSLSLFRCLCRTVSAGYAESGSGIFGKDYIFFL